MEAGDEHGPWKVTVAAYDYVFSDVTGRELVAYHWHPGGASHVDSPHLHLGVATGISHAGLREAHLPTGRVSLESIVRLAIEAFGVRPLRADWRRVLDQGEAAFNRRRTW